MFSTIWIAA